ncbi:MAG: hypothetical protein KGN36_11290 [Acidobacteriota bacterium]|nr:hypothetical protein [Acidobacteriota bacterium]
MATIRMIIEPWAVLSEQPTRKGDMRAVRLIGVASLFLASLNAADLPITPKLAQTPNSDLEASIGGVVFRVNRTSPLPNAFGKADIFGRRVDRGFVELRYKGRSPDGLLMFQLTDVDTISNETTMNRTPTEVTTGRAQVSTLGNSATGTQQSTTVRAEAGKTVVLPPDTTPFTIDPAKKREFKIGDVTVQIFEVDELSLKYRLLWTAPRKK